MIPLHDDNPTERTPVVTIAFIVVCVLVFFYQASLPAGSGETFVFQYGAIPALVFGEADLPETGVAIPVYATLITSMFLHGGCTSGSLGTTSKTSWGIGSTSCSTSHAEFWPP
jgi:membrane associated rhomboid family serine protease